MKEKAANTFYTDEIAEKYFNIRNKSELWIEEQKFLMKYIDRIIEGSSLLDIPVGTGRFIPYYLKKNLKIYAVDISDDMIRFAKRYIGKDSEKVTFITGDARDLKLKNQSIDYIVCVRLLNLFPFEMADEIIKELGRISRNELFVQIRVRDTSKSSMIYRIISSGLKNLFKSLKKICLRIIGTEQTIEHTPERKWIHHENKIYESFKMHGFTVYKREIINEPISKKWLKGGYYFFTLKKV